MYCKYLYLKLRHKKLIQQVLPLWGFSLEAEVDLLNISENTTFKITHPEGQHYILRLYRTGHHSKAAIASELAWMQALNNDHILPTPKVIAGINGAEIQQYDGSFLVLFEFLSGDEPQMADDLRQPFQQLGKLAARTHLHSQNWQRPKNFTRPTWDETAVFEPDPLWGHWRTGPNVQPEHCRILEAAQTQIQKRLAHYGKAPERFGLIHADMRLANLLVNQDTTHVIDFDDCGFSWWMYDFAAAISFFEDHPQIPALKQAWLSGYQTIRSLEPEDIAEMDTLIVLRRMHLLGWLGTHQDTEIYTELAPHFAEGTAKLAQVI